MGALYLDGRPTTMTPSISHAKGNAVRGHLNAKEKLQENIKQEATEESFPSHLLFAMKRKVIKYIERLVYSFNSISAIKLYN